MQKAAPRKLPAGVPINGNVESAPARWPGVMPSLALEQVKNTAPYVFENEIRFENAPHVVLLRSAVLYEWAGCRLDRYFMLLASAHYASVATFVPTDFDNSIRIKLWSLMGDEERSSAGRWVLESYGFNFSSVSERWIDDGMGGKLQGHHGEWLGLAVAAWSSNRKCDPKLAAELLDQIHTQYRSARQAFVALYEARAGLKLWCASSIIAHNLGDFDRVYEAWGLDRRENPFEELYRMGHMGSPEEPLFVACDLNKAFLAEENHRHFALRRPRGIRKFRDLLLPIGPFFDGWGGKVASHALLTDEEKGEVIEALIDGWVRLGGFGYARALSGIESSIPGGLSSIGRIIPARQLRRLRTGLLRARIGEERARFERRWNLKGLELMDERLRINASARKKTSAGPRNPYNTGKETFQFSAAP